MFRGNILACRENKAEFEGFLGEEFDAYTAQMERLGTWGDELSLVSALHRKAHHWSKGRMAQWQAMCLSTVIVWWTIASVRNSLSCDHHSYVVQRRGDPTLHGCG